MRDQVFSKPVFEDIRKYISRCLSADDPMQHIESVMEALRIGDLGEAFFDVAWDNMYFTHEMEKS